jgi:hypothetical protein
MQTLTGQMQSVEVWYAEVNTNQYAIFTDTRDTLPAYATCVKQFNIETTLTPALAVRSYAEQIARDNPGWTIDSDAYGMSKAH